MPLVLDWSQASTPPEDIALQAARALKNGQMVLLPTEAGYMLAVDSTYLNRAERSPKLPDNITGKRFKAFATVAEFIRHHPALSERELAFAFRIWPGPIAWKMAGKSVPAWVPMHMAAGMVLDQIGSADFFEIEQSGSIDTSASNDTFAIMINAGPIAPARVTQVRMNDRIWSIDQPGMITESELKENLARRILFVCTGNTCRSPMAAAIFRHRLANRLGCSIEQLLSAGYVVESAGVSATDGDPATPEAVRILKDWDVSLEDHRSKLATRDLVASADDLIVMTRGHLLSILSHYPAIRGNMRLIGGLEGDLNDPFGSDLDVYQKCAKTIQNHVDRLITEMGLI